MVIIFPEKWSDTEKRLLKTVMQDVYSQLQPKGGCNYECSQCEIRQLCQDIGDIVDVTNASIS